jgi:hypothetical protein
MPLPMTDRQQRIVELRKLGWTRADIAKDLACSVPTVARELAALRRLFDLPADLMRIETKRAVELLVESEAAGRRDKATAPAIRNRGDLALSVHNGLDADSRALVQRPTLRAWANAIGRSRSTAYRVCQRFQQEDGTLPPADKIRDELRMALNAVRRARRLIVADNCLATREAWDELRALITELEELNALGG